MPKPKGAKGTFHPTLFPPDSAWVATRVEDLPQFKDCKMVGFDTETRDPGLDKRVKLGPGMMGRGNDSYMIGFSFAIENGPKHYVPLRHEDGGNVDDPHKAIEWMRDQCKQFQGIAVGMNFGYDLGWFAHEDIRFNPNTTFRDVQIAEAILYELHDSYSLEEISKRHGFGGKTEGLLKEAAAAYGVDPKSGMWQLHAKYVGPYAADDALLPIQVWRKQEARINEDGLQPIHELESKLLPVLVKMRERGVRVNEDKLSQIEEWSRREETEALDFVTRETGRRITWEDLWSSEALAGALANVGIHANVTAAGNASVDKELLATAEHPVAEKLLYARKVNKLRTTFADSVRRHMVRGRIHCTFNQLAQENEETGGIKGARFGRLSSEHVNMQQQPARDEFAAMWRDIYEPEHDAYWCSADYSQQEPRMTTHYAELTGCDGAYEAAEAYRQDPNTDNHDMMTRLVYGDAAVDSWDKPTWKKFRGYCKNIYLGLCYEMGGAKLARNLGLPTRWAVFPERYGGEVFYFESDAEAYAHVYNNGGRANEVAGEEAQAILDKFNSRAPFIKQLSKKCQKRVKQVGYITTILGRRCRFPMREDGGGYDWVHKALNRLIQGSSADQTKLACVQVEEAGHFLQLQVHDELVLSVSSEAEAQQVAKLMRDGVPLRVPSKVDVELGASWGKAA